MIKRREAKKTNDKATRILQNIITRRKELNFSQADIADTLYISLSGYFKIENGTHKLDTHRLIDIAEILKIKPEEFFK